MSKVLSISTDSANSPSSTFQCDDSPSLLSALTFPWRFLFISGTHGSEDNCPTNEHRTWTQLKKAVTRMSTHFLYSRIWQAASSWSHLRIKLWCRVLIMKETFKPWGYKLECFPIRSLWWWVCAELWGKGMWISMLFVGACYGKERIWGWWKGGGKSWWHFRF